VLVNNPAHHPDGDFFLKHGLVKADEGNIPSQKLTFSGLGIYNPALFTESKAGRFSLVPLLKAAMADSKVTGEAYRGHWYDSGTEDRLASLREAVATTAG
jgi:MurNAc alpha-1-phosphate uridylyltransferase